MLYEKIINIYPELRYVDFFGSGIVLQNEGHGDYIAAWNHPTLPQPTEAELDAASDAPPREVYSCSPWQIRKALLNQGLRQTVEDAVAASTDYILKDGWEYASSFVSNDPFVISMGTSLGMDQDGIDNLIQYAATL